MLKDKKIVLAISGGIAAYKAIDLCSKLRKQGAQVKVVLTQNARQFVTELPFRVLSGNPVHTTLWNKETPIPHIELSDWADMIVIAPATANVIAKAATGLGDDLLSSTLLAAHTPVLMIPAMNIHMYENPSTQTNLKNLKQRGYLFMEPEEGPLACGYSGKGRYPANEEIIYFVTAYLEYKSILKGKKILVTAGACRESIDPMRFISNRSTGRMGISLARAAHILGAEVTLIKANTDVNSPEYIETISVETASDMLKTCQSEFPRNDILIMNAAVSDYKPATVSAHKIKKGDNIKLDLIRTMDVLSQLSEVKRQDQIVCGFAAESDDLIINARKKLEKKQLDVIIANDLGTAGKDITECIYITRDQQLDIKGDKFSVALKILDNLANIKK